MLGSREMPGAEWFPGGAPVLRRAHASAARTPAHVAIRHASELRELGRVTWGELRERDGPDRRRPARRTAWSEGDRVAAYMPNIPETMAAFLACASIGAVWSSASPDFGARSGGRPLRADRAEGAAGRRRLPLRRQGLRPHATWWRASPRRSATRRWCEFGYLERQPAGPTAPGRRRRARVRAAALRPPAVGALQLGHHRLPKAIVHGQGGILLEHLKKMHLHVDAQEGDRVFWFTTTGWMMWNFLVGVLLTAGRDRALRRQPRPPRPGRAVGPGRATPA